MLFFSYFSAGTHLTSFVAATPLSLIQASNGQVYILQNQQQTSTSPQGAAGGIPQGTTQFFPAQMILATTTSNADNSTLLLATTGSSITNCTTNKLTSCHQIQSTTTNWIPSNTTNTVIPRVMVDTTFGSRNTVSAAVSDSIDLTKSKKTGSDIVTKALVASKVLKGC